MKSNSEKVGEYIRQSPLALVDKAEFSDFLLRATDAELAPLAELFQKDASWVEKLFHNYKDKKAALHNRDPKLWEKILDEEERMIRSEARQ